MADGNVDISGMPDPGSIGLDPAKQADPAADMPEPEDLYRKFHFGGGALNANGKHGPIEPIPKDALDDFMANPPSASASENFRKGASALTGLPRAAAGYASAVPAGVASVAGQATGALGAALDPENASSYLEQGRERGRRWSSNLSDYVTSHVPATKAGAELSSTLMELPGQVGHSINRDMIAPVVGENASQMIGDIAQDVGADLPAAGAPAAVRGGAKLGARAAKAAKGAYQAEAASLTPPGDEPAAPIKPPVGNPITGDSLRAQPNPIPPPTGTHAHVKATQTAPAPSPNEISPPVQQEGAPAPSVVASPEMGSTQVAAPQPNAAPGASAEAAPITAAEKYAANRALNALDDQRGSVRLFNSPAEEGPKETPAPEKQSERAAHLDAIDELSGGLLPTRRTSALTGDYNATGDDWQMKEVGNEKMRTQMASENAAMHAAADNVHASIGSEFENSVDSQTLGDRGRVTRGAIQGIEGWFDKATDGLYDRAREQNQGRPIPALKRVQAYLNDDSNFTNDAEIGLQRAAKQRLERLWTTGDPDKGTPPGSVNAAERFREFLNEKGRNPSAMGVAKDLKNHTDMDVAEHGGPGLFEAARAMRRHSAQLLEEPTGIKKLLTPGDSQGINHAIPEHKVMDYITDLPREQHEHVLNVLRAGAHLGDGELAASSAAALREIQAHVVSRMHNAARNADGSWNARKFYNAADRYARNAPDTFKDRPDVLNNLKTINDAGNTLNMDKHYPGAAAQTERTGAIGHALEAGGNIAASFAHEIPAVGRFIGRRIESAVDRASGKIGDSARDRAVARGLVDRNGKQRGSVQVMPSNEEIEKNGEHVTLATPVTHTTDLHGDHVFSTGEGKSHLKAEETPDGGLRVRGSFTHLDDQRQGHGGVLYKHAADQALKNGGSFTSDEKVSESAARRWAALRQQGYAVERNPRAKPTADKGLITDDGSPVFDIKPKAPTAQLNVGLHIGDPANGGRVNNPREVVKAIQELGVKPTRGSVVNSNSEPTLVTDIHRPLTAAEGVKLATRTGQESIAQRHADGTGTMLGAKVNSAKAKAEGWDKYSPDYFRQHDGRTQSEHDTVKVPAGQRGSFSFQNDNALNRSTAGSRDAQRGGERNPRSEYNANDRLAGGRKLSDEQQNILSRLGQRGSVRVMNEKPMAGAPEGDKPNGKARAAAAAYARSAGIDYKPLDEYKFVDPKVAKNVADAYDEMKHDPANPKVAKAYDAFKAETLAQYKQMVKAGVKVDLDPSYPYKNPREMHDDVRANNHMSVYPTEEGFGTTGAPPSDHPMLEKAPVKVGGKDATYNDLFRAVHDYYGHAAEGNGFRANGEYNAWRAHRGMYSTDAQPAMDSETLGQNSWVNSGPPGELNKGASGADTIYADQKAGLLPKAVVKSAEAGVNADEHHITNQLTDKERGQLRNDTTKRLVDTFNSAPATKEYAAAALAGAAKRGWYRNSAQAIVNQFGHDAPRFAGLLSAMSPQVSVQTNFANALKTFINWDKAGRPEDPDEIRGIMEQSSQKSAKAAPGSSNVLDAWVNNAVRALTADDPTSIKLSGPKVHSFYNNLTDNVHEVTNDAWMASFAKIDPAKLGGSLNGSGPGKSPSYLALSAKVRDAARMISHLTGETWTPAEVQETVWSWAKTAYEHAEEKGSNVSIPDLIKNGDITDELIRSTPDFHQLFSTSEHRGLLQSSSFAGNAERMAKWQKQGTDAAGSSKARQAAESALRPHLISAAERLESVRQERRAAGKGAPKDQEED